MAIDEHASQHVVAGNAIDVETLRNPLWLAMVIDGHASQSIEATTDLDARTVVVFFFFLTLLLSSFWTSRGHRCRPFSPPVLAFNFYRA